MTNGDAVRPPDDGSDAVWDLLVVGGGVMGLFTAYHASQRGRTVAVIERGRIGDPATASYGRTRTYRRDYLEPVYARFADEAIRLWGEFEAQTGADALVRCGCMNIATAAVTPDLATTYARMSFEVLDRLGMPMEVLDAEAISRRFDFLRADVAYLDAEAGLVDLPAVTAALLAALEERQAAVHQGVEIDGLEPDGPVIRVRSGAGALAAKAVVVTAGHGTNDVLALLRGCSLQVPITRDRPSEAKYFAPPAAVRHRFTSDAMPVIAYLDTGIYLHPIVDGLIDAVKIGYYNPPDMPRGRSTVGSIADFVEQCMPGLIGSEVSDVADVDQCDYDLVGDDDFVLGAVPGFDNVFVGVGWRGTGYKFSPWVGRVLAELATREGTVYDISRFDPARFDPARFDTVAGGLGTSPEGSIR